MGGLCSSTRNNEDEQGWENIGQMMETMGVYSGADHSDDTRSLKTYYAKVLTEYGYPNRVVSYLEQEKLELVHKFAGSAEYATLLVPEPKCCCGVPFGEIIQFAEAVIVTFFQLNFQIDLGFNSATAFAVVLPVYSLLNSVFGFLDIEAYVFSNLFSLFLAATTVVENEDGVEIFYFVILQAVTASYSLFLEFRIAFLLRYSRWTKELQRCGCNSSTATKKAALAYYLEKLIIIAEKSDLPAWLNKNVTHDWECLFCIFPFEYLLKHIFYIFITLPDYLLLLLTSVVANLAVVAQKVFVTALRGCGYESCLGEVVPYWRFYRTKHLVLTIKMYNMIKVVNWLVLAATISLYYKYVDTNA